VYCVWQAVKTPTIILNNSVFSLHAGPIVLSDHLTNFIEWNVFEKPLGLPVVKKSLVFKAAWGFHCGFHNSLSPFPIQSRRNPVHAPYCSFKIKFYIISPTPKSSKLSLCLRFANQNPVISQRIQPITCG